MRAAIATLDKGAEQIARAHSQTDILHRGLEPRGTLQAIAGLLHVVLLQRVSNHIAMTSLELPYKLTPADPGVLELLSNDTSEVMPSALVCCAVNESSRT